MSTQHTPGPWYIEKRTDMEGYWITIPAPIGRKVIAEIDTGFDEPWDSQQHANARLIATAPELLAALRLIADTHASDGALMTSAARQKIARAAIAKAQGNS